jgi:hypothetical protein
VRRPAGVQCDPDCVLMQDPAAWFDGDLHISDADPGL